MASDHLGPGVSIKGPLLSPGHGFGLGFAVRTHDGMAPFAGSAGQFFWSGVAGTFFWIDPREQLFAVFMSQARASATIPATWCGGWCTPRWSEFLVPQSSCRPREGGRPVTTENYAFTHCIHTHLPHH